MTYFWWLRRQCAFATGILSRQTDLTAVTWSCLHTSVWQAPPTLCTVTAVMLRPPGTCCCRVLVTRFLLQGQGAASTAAVGSSTAAVAPDRLCAGHQQQHMCLPEVPAVATAPPQRLQGPRSVPAHPEQPTAGAQHTQIDTTSAAAATAAAAAAAAERPADMSQGLQALLVQLAGHLDAVNPSAPLTAVQHRPGSRQLAAADMPMLLPGLQGQRAFAFEATGFPVGSASTGGFAAGDQGAVSAGSGLPLGGFRFGLSTASQVCT